MKKIIKILLVVIMFITVITSYIVVSGTEIIITPPEEEEHMYKVTGYDNDYAYYKCEDCGDIVFLERADLYALWDIIYINQTVNTSDIDDSCFLDLCSDGIINAKDYAIICRY